MPELVLLFTYKTVKLPIRLQNEASSPEKTEKRFYRRLQSTTAFSGLPQAPRRALFRTRKRSIFIEYAIKITVRLTFPEFMCTMYI